ncbi:upf0182 protein [Leptolyngbya sp. Heron Island J]|uniref:UPF0182 family membrane protein n=1 Tax=Leptolyngbya sp. Heron Island J TaxID=1385935 RepID=UPI0003B986DD|nr:UPF0182 family protein [Leptolyngbya sp. Heron Island J]ESA34973.1 upf0182 protein [Leptolyngbya sp. Heron Island J]
MSSKWLWLIFGGVIAIVFSGTLVHLTTEVWWFDAIGFSDVLWTRWRWQIAIALLAFASWWGLLFLNFAIAQHITRERPLRVVQNPQWEPYLPGMIRYGSLGLITLLALSAAINAAEAWQEVLKFLHPVDFGAQDPLYGREISFYIFQLPLFENVHRATIELLLWSLVLTACVYGIKGEIRPERGWKYFLTGEVKTHFCVLLAALATIFALGFWLARYELLYSPTGVVFGAGYTDVNARMQAYGIMGFITLAIGILFLASLWRSGFLLPLTAISLYAAIFVLITGLYPWAQQKFVVEPNELQKEAPYIADNIELTRLAYGLNDVQQQSFEVKNQLDATQLERNHATIDNIRLWDYRPLQSTYGSLQTLRPYYRFQDVDIDRYTFDDDYRQVMLSPRELVDDALPAQAQTWVNQHLIYTHGYGLAMSPVNKVTEDGLPELFIKDLPPKSSVDLTIEQPRIYYGEATDRYILTGTAQAEFDYPLGNDNAQYNYTGPGGVPIGSFLRRLVYAYNLGDWQLLFSNSLGENSRIHYHRLIQQRIRQLAPFLSLDSDPYLAVIDGRLKWIVDAYTLSDRYPYSEPLIRSEGIQDVLQGTAMQRIVRRGTNYIRNPVKAVVDAYDGTVKLYVVDTTDPILTSFQQIFPTLFELPENIPADLWAHFRYPQMLFKIQAQIYRAYHMDRPDVFYNQEDLWDFPTQITREESPEILEPYYVIMKLPEGKAEEFMLIVPFTPVGKNNMVAWMAARCDGDNYGKLLVYEFSRQALLYGPRQIDSRIDQDTEISQQLTLWNQEGSEVFRGDLLVLPIEESLLYVKPVYLQARSQDSNSNAIPELKRVIVAYKDSIVMEQTLEDSLTKLFGQRRSAVAVPAPGPATSTSPSDTPSPTAAQQALLQAALDAYTQGQQALQNGDWQAYGEAQTRLGRLLDQLTQTAQ